MCRGVFVADLENVCREMSKNGVFLAPSHDAVDDELFMECALQVSVVVVFSEHPNLYGRDSNRACA